MSAFRLAGKIRSRSIDWHRSTKVAVLFFFFLFFLFALRTRRGTNALAGKRREREMESGLLNRIIPGRETVANRIRGSKRGPYCIQFGHCC